MRDDDPTLELLSRHLDGDLDAAEERALALRLERDEGLRRELDGLAAVAAVLRRIAEAERPPATLDRVIEPLLVGPAPPARRRPPLPRVLAVAAAAVLGATLVVELAQRRGEEPATPQAVRTAAPRAAASGERFALAPLPSRAPNEEERPRGAVDRLLAEDAPAVAAADEAPPPLEVLGPLDVPTDATPSSDVEALPAGRGGSRPPRAAADAGATASAAPRDEPAPAPPGGREEAGRPGPLESEGVRGGSNATAADGQLLVFLEGQTAWRSFEPRERCDPGRYAVRVRIERGTVRRVWPVWKPLAAPTESLQASELVLGLEIDGVADGEYAAEVVIEAPRPR